MVHFEDRTQPALITEHPGMNSRDTALFKRKWEVSRSLPLVDAC
jgi:hypothetical protein